MSGCFGLFTLQPVSKEHTNVKFVTFYLLLLYIYLKNKFLVYNKGYTKLYTYNFSILLKVLFKCGYINEKNELLKLFYYCKLPYIALHIIVTYFDFN